MSKFGFVYLWYDRSRRRFYIGSHWGTLDDGYICSSSWMKISYKRRPQDFKRRILKIITTNKKDMFAEEQRWLEMIKPSEIKPYNEKPRYYNLMLKAEHIWHGDEEKRKSVGEKISAKKKGKPTGPCSSEKAKKISEAKLKKNAEKRALLGYVSSPEHIKKMSETKRAQNRKHTDEWKRENSERLKEQWANGTRRKVA